MNATRTVRIGDDTEWVEEYHGCGRIMVFTNDREKALTVDWNYLPCRERGMEIIEVARTLYRRSFWGQEIK